MAGCRRHGVSAEDCEKWWQRSEERDAQVRWCQCCRGPAPVALIPIAAGGHYGLGMFCLRCEVGVERPTG